jgi:TIR domain-containing protein
MSSGPEAIMAAANVFISYSREDQKWLERLQVHLKPLIRDSVVDVWADTRLQAGDNWRAEIGRAIEQASVAVLLISADFLASDFVTSEELPALLEAAEQRGLRILQVIVSPCRFERTPLARLQTVNSPAEPLVNLNDYQRESLFDRLAGRIESTVQAENFRAQIDSVHSRLDEMSRRVAELFLTTMSLAMYQNLFKIVNAPFGPYQMSAGLRRELDYLRTVGYLEIDGLSRIPVSGRNLSDFVRPTEAGKQFVRLREEMELGRRPAGGRP